MRWTNEVSDFVGAFPGVDAYVDWSLGSGQPYYNREKRPFPIIIKTKSISTERFHSGVDFFDSESEQDKWRDGLRIPIPHLENSENSVEGSSGGSVFTVYPIIDFFAYFKNNGKIRNSIERLSLGVPLTEKRFLIPPAHVELPFPTDNPPPKVIVGAIDDSFGIAHKRFRYFDDATRIFYYWLQGHSKSDNQIMGYGRELRKADASTGTSRIPGIDSYLRDSEVAGVVDEDRFYRLAGLACPDEMGLQGTASRASHGTHVLDLACGDDPEGRPGTRLESNRDNGPQTWGIVAVQLPRETTEDTAGGSLDAYVIDGIAYILDRADHIAKDWGNGLSDRDGGLDPLPVVINISYGMLAGPHDGTSELEMKIDQLVREREARTGAPTRVVLPAGNSRLSRCHARITFKSEGKKECLHWHVQPDDHTPSFLEIWMPHHPTSPSGDPDPERTSRVKLSIKPPYGEKSPDPLEEEHGRVLRLNSGDEVLCEARYAYSPGPTKRGIFLVALPPTAQTDRGRAGDPERTITQAGIWTIELENVSLTENEPVEAWIHRDQAPHGYKTLARQSDFGPDCSPMRSEPVNGDKIAANGCYVEEDLPVEIRSSGTINAIATGRQPVVMGGFVGKEMIAADYSAGGPIKPPFGLNIANRPGPDAMAISEDSLVHRGLLAAGTRSGSFIPMGGTSVAAPQTTRWIASQMEEKRSSDRTAVAELARRFEKSYETSPCPVPPRPCPERGGDGRIKLERTDVPKRYWD